MTVTKFIAYYRVSTNKQGKSGLGIEAQQASVADYLATTSGELVNEFIEVQSGKDNQRPELAKALRKCRLTGATLVIAKLDRLSRNAAFLMNLQESAVNFICCDMPEANTLTVGLMACMAEYERKRISENTKAALKAAKARGVKLGNPRLDEVRCTDITAAQTARIAKAKARNSEILDVINEIQSEAGELSLRAISRRLNEAGYRTSRGKDWQATSVKRILAA
jgi:DNA invertase Pin-like site-specific DNA recombinase